MKADVIIRPESAEDFTQVDRINQLVFDGDAEMQVVQQIRGSKLLILSLVAELDGFIVGHILFSRGFIQTADCLVPSVALGPMGVHPDFQRKGMGSHLVLDGLAKLRESGEQHCFVLGHTWFYPKFGFKPAKYWQIDSVYQADDHFLGLEIAPEALHEIRGRFLFPEAFDGG